MRDLRSVLIPRSAAHRVLYLLYSVALAVCVGLITWSHTAQTRSLLHTTQERLAGIAGTLGGELDGGRILRLLERYDSRGMLVQRTQEARYYVLQQALERGVKANGLETPLALVHLDATKQELQLVASSGPDPVLRDRYQGPCADALAALLKADGNGPLQGRWGDQVAAFSIVRTVQGRAVAALVAESSHAALLAQVQARTLRLVLVAAVVMLLFGVLVVRRVAALVRKEEVERLLWQARHEGISDSIAYAGKIQGALIPKADRYREMFADHFILNRPKDVVSGDFHWYHRLGEDECIVAAADCTGHGAPGAMIAAIGCSLLNELVTQRPELDPAEMLGLLNERLLAVLDQQGQRKGAGDGMDIALCRIDRKRRELLFAGAFRPLYWMHDGQLTVVNGDRKPIGGSQYDPRRKFTVHRIAYHPGDRIYLFSDGYVDQFGGPERRKFMAARFNEMLVANQQLDMPAQGELLERVFVEWKGEQEQVDDVMVLGLQAA